MTDSEAIQVMSSSEEKLFVKGKSKYFSKRRKEELLRTALFYYLKSKFFSETRT